MLYLKLLKKGKNTKTINSKVKENFIFFTSFEIFNCCIASVKTAILKEEQSYYEFISKNYYWLILLHMIGLESLYIYMFIYTIIYS